MKKLLLLLFIVAIAAQADTQKRKLLKIVSIIRHGARTPLKSLYVAEHWDGIEEGGLTKLGAMQEYLLGKWTQQLYIHDTDLLEDEVSSGICHKSKISAIFSCAERTIQSGFNFLKGLCSSNYEEILHYVIDKYLSTEITDPSEREMLKSKTDFKQLFEVDKLITSCSLEDRPFFDLGHPKFCPAVQLAYQDVWKTHEFQSKYIQLKSNPLYGEVVEIMRLQDPSQSEQDEELYDLVGLKGVWSAHQCYIFHGKKSPFKFTAKQIELLYQVAEFVYYDLENGNHRARSLKGSLLLDNLRDLVLDLSTVRRLLEDTPSNIETLPLTSDTVTDLINQLDDAKEPVASASALTVDVMPVPPEASTQSSSLDADLDGEIERLEDSSSPSALSSISEETDESVPQVVQGSSSGSGTSEEQEELEVSAEEEEQLIISLDPFSEGSARSSASVPVTVASSVPVTVVTSSVGSTNSSQKEEKVKEEILHDIGEIIDIIDKIEDSKASGSILSSGASSATQSNVVDTSSEPSQNASTASEPVTSETSVNSSPSSQPPLESSAVESSTPSIAIEQLISSASIQPATPTSDASAPSGTTATSTIPEPTSSSSDTQTPEPPKSQLQKLPLDGFTLYSAHDTTIMNILSILLTEEDFYRVHKLPNFAAQLNFEFWSSEDGQLEVIIRYNQRKLNILKHCVTTRNHEATCSGEDFLRLLNEKITSEVMEECKKF